jgi:hypothetical protein
LRSVTHRFGLDGIEVTRAEGLEASIPIRGLVITYQVEFKGKALRPRRKKTAPARGPGPEVVDQNHAGSLPGSSRAHNALARLADDSGRERIGHAFALKIGTPPKLKSGQKKEAPASMLGPLFTDEFLTDYFAGACLCESAGT